MINGNVNFRMDVRFTARPNINNKVCYFVGLARSDPGRLVRWLNCLDELNHQMDDLENALTIVQADTALCKILFYL